MAGLTRALTSPAARSPWIGGAPFDLAFIFGGAVLSLMVAIVTLGLHVPIVPVFWAWLVLFDGPHMMATYSRTFLDLPSLRRRGVFFACSLVSFAIGPATVAASRVVGSPALFSLFLGAATLVASHHVVRQHYGFIAIYKSKAGERGGFWIDRWATYAGCWAPYIYFIVDHPRARVLIGLGGPAPFALRAGLVAVWAVSLLAIVANSVRQPREARSTPKLVYGSVVLLLYGAAYFWLARFEPLYTASRGPDEDFLFLTVFVSIFHSTQYLALVALHNRSRYRDGDAGPASWMTASAWRAVAVFATFAALYWTIAKATGVYPNLWGSSAGGEINELALALWWGIAIHHYVLDAKIWRIKTDPDLRRHLGLQRPAPLPAA